jgi:stage II sporulation protein D
MLSSMSVAGAQVRTAFGTTTVVSNANVRVMDSSGRLVTVSTDSTANGNFSVSGAGHGHGVGMCQLGAIGMAGAGYTYEAILQHYFTGAQIEKAELR